MFEVEGSGEEGFSVWRSSGSDRGAGSGSGLIGGADWDTRSAMSALIGRKRGGSLADPTGALLPFAAGVGRVGVLGGSDGVFGGSAALVGGAGDSRLRLRMARLSR